MIEFNGPSKVIELHETESGSINVDIKEDFYSDWKIWTQSGSNSKYLPAFRSIGGDPTTGTKSVAPYFFLTNGWKCQPCVEHDHTITLVGNLFVDEPSTYGDNVFIAPTGSHTVLVNMSTTSDATTLTATAELAEADKEEIAEKTKSKILPLIFLK